MVNIIINGQNLSVEDGISILEAARRNGIDIPTLCYLKGVNEIGSCRLCMVEINGYEGMFAACKTKVKEGMEITTHSEKTEDYRRQMLRLLLSNHHV
ncbi:MAG: (2Fe-2S)-binding protein, partial [Lachnospiraceae bacterium]|nr:(2Fe-2S)-binding protein [Lachnospiraceae bacterium]